MIGVWVESALNHNWILLFFCRTLRYWGVTQIHFIMVERSTIKFEDMSKALEYLIEWNKYPNQRKQGSVENCTNDKMECNSLSYTPFLLSLVGGLIWLPQNLRPARGRRQGRLLHPADRHLLRVRLLRRRHSERYRCPGWLPGMHRSTLFLPHR